MPWLTIAKYGIPALIAVFWLVRINDAIYDRGHAAGLIACASTCKDEQDKTKEKNDALIAHRDRIARDLANYKRLHSNTCLYIAGNGKLQPVADEHAGVHGIDTDQLRGFAGVCETLRSELAESTGRSEELETNTP